MSVNRKVKVPRGSAADSVIPGAPGRRSVPVGFGQVAQAAVISRTSSPCCAARRDASPRRRFPWPPHICDHARMAEREDLIDTIAAFALFADTPGPRLEAIVHLFDERLRRGREGHPPGPAGSAFYIILEAKPGSSSMARNVHGSAAAISSVRSRCCSVRRRSPTSSRSVHCAPRPARPGVEASCSTSADHVPDAPGEARRLRAANRWRS